LLTRVEVIGSHPGGLFSPSLFYLTIKLAVKQNLSIENHLLRLARSVAPTYVHQPQANPTTFCYNQLRTYPIHKKED